MSVEIRVPPLGESLVDAVVGEWLKQEGEAVSRGETVVLLETDKVNLDVTAEEDGVLAQIARQAGETVAVGDVLGLVSGDGAAAATGDRLRRVYVYRSGKASWYGPGFYGNSTACGGALTAGRLGVANRYLPCGTRVTFRYRGRSVTAPVIDRGPFAAGRDWDLTAATKQRLGFGDVGVIWSTR